MHTQKIVCYLQSQHVGGWGYLIFPVYLLSVSFKKLVSYSTYCFLTHLFSYQYNIHSISSYPWGKDSNASSLFAKYRNTSKKWENSWGNPRIIKPATTMSNWCLTSGENSGKQCQIWHSRRERAEVALLQLLSVTGWGALPGCPAEKFPNPSQSPQAEMQTLMSGSRLLPLHK